MKLPYAEEVYPLMLLLFVWIPKSIMVATLWGIGCWTTGNTPRLVQQRFLYKVRPIQVGFTREIAKLCKGSQS